MKIALRVAVLAVLAGLGCWLWTVFFPSPQRIVLKKIAGLAQTATVATSDGNLTRAAKATSIVGLFANDAEIVLDVPGFAARTLNGRDEIREATMGGLASLSSLKVQFFDATASVGADKQSAQVACTARVTPDDSKDIGIQELRFSFKKIDGDWLITRVQTVQTLQ